MDRNAIISALIMSGYYRGNWSAPQDLAFSTISPAFVTDALPEWVRSLPLELTEDAGYGQRKVRWLPEAFDCNSIADDFIAFLRKCMAVDRAKGRPRGKVAAGQFSFAVDAITNHAIVWFVGHDGKVHHCDPAIAKIDHLNNDRIPTIYEGSFA
jgi:hypothetical protein